MNAEYWNKYFEDNSKHWIDGAYKNSEYTYPVGYHRLRILKRIFSRYDIEGKRVLDIGCGGGDISFFAASMGAIVDGIDMSESMLEIAEKRKKNLPTDVQARVSFHRSEFHNISKLLFQEKYDFVIAFGLIGYIESDVAFFKTVKELCHKNTVLIFSCRNRLFNMTSITNNTVEEIEKGQAINLIKEIDTYYKKDIPQEKISKFINNLRKTIETFKLNETDKSTRNTNQSMDGLPGTGKEQPRQSTPMSVSEDALKYGFVPKKFFGVHPHLLLPRLNKKLPPTMFNLLSDALCVFEDEPISLIYSSVFIAEMECQV